MKAFPLTNTNTQHTGMDLRDYFAAEAMQVYLTATMGQTVDLANIAANAFMAADAMMEARTK